MSIYDVSFVAVAKHSTELFPSLWQTTGVYFFSNFDKLALWKVKVIIPRMIDFQSMCICIGHTLYRFHIQIPGYA